MSRRNPSVRTLRTTLLTTRRNRRLTLEGLESRALLAGITVELPEPSAGSQAPTATQPLSGNSFSSESPEPNAPGLGTTIAGITFDEDATQTGFLQIPPDPIGAAGPNHVVSVVNSSIEWHTKAGVQEFSDQLGKNGSGVDGFFAPVNPVNLTFDPKVIYDQHAGRFVVVTLERTDDNDGSTIGDAADTSRILVAVSDDSDPNGSWRFLAINSKINIGGIDRWADYPGFAVDEEAVYITNNMFGFGGGAFGGVRLWIIPKGVGTGGLYDASGGSFTIHDPYATAGIATTTQPAHIYGTAPGTTGTFLVSYSGLSGGGIESVQVVRVNNPLTSPTFSQQFVSVGDIEDTNALFNDAPQSGSATLVETNDRRALNSVWRGDSLWVTATIVGSGTDAGQTTSYWWELNTTTLATITVAQQGGVGGEAIAAGAYTFMSSIAVDANENMAIGFAVSAPTIFPSAGYTGRKAGATAGTTEPAAILKAGEASYVRTFGGPRNRWGDYSGTVLDPADERTFWIYNEYAFTQGTVSGGENGRWATYWGSFQFNTAPVITTLAFNSAENQTAVGTVTATDIDGDTRTFSETGGADAALLSITSGGVITFGSARDFENPTDANADGIYELQVTVSDGHGGSDVETILITVTNVADNNLPPTAVSFSNTTTSLPENSSTAADVLLANIDVADDGQGTNTLSLFGGDAASFVITGGQLFLKAGTALNFETKSTYEVTVRVDDTTVGSTPDASAVFTLTLTDVNEAPTAVVLSDTGATLAENTAVPEDLLLADIDVTDDALGTNTLSLFGADAGFFTITAGQLFLNADTVLDFEAKGSYSVTVRVDDTAVGSTPDATAVFTLTISNVNEAPTAVGFTATTTSVAENTAIAADLHLADIGITDDALGTNDLSLSGADAGFFTIVSGELFLKSGTVLNFETKNSYSVTVRVDDTAVGATPDASQLFTLTVTDVNEAPTAVGFTDTTTSLAENTAIAADLHLADIGITDDALGTNDLSLSGADAGFFTIVSGELFLKAGTVLNFETKNSYSVTVRVDDTAVGSNPDASQLFTLTVTDVNEAPTAVGFTDTTTSVAENTNIAADLHLADIGITDDALGTNDLSLSGADVGFFTIVSGELFLKSGTVLNFETKGSYSVTVRVDDTAVGANPDASQLFTLTVTDVNEAPTAVGFTDTTTSVAENTNIAADLHLADIGITDDALGTNDLSLSGADAGFFTIVNGELFLKSGTVLNFETKGSYSVTVRVDDTTVGATPDASQLFTLTVTDVNEAPTAVAFTDTTTSVAENTAIAADLHLADIGITDDALGTNDLSLSGADAGFFTIVSGELFLKSGTVLNVEAKSSYSVTVRVDDAGVGSNPDASQLFTLTVTDVNEAPTAIDLSGETSSLPEDTDTAADVQVATIDVTDDALGTNDLTLTGDDAAFFVIAGNALFLKAGTVLDFENQATYDVTVQVDDTAVGSTPDAALNFTLTITDVNEGPTAVDFSNTTETLPEDRNTAEDIHVADIEISDDAQGTNELTLSGPDAAFFKIESGALYLKAGTVLNFEAKGSYEVTVEADDPAVGSSPDASAVFTLTIPDVNDAPLLNTAVSVSLGSIAEDTAAGSNAGTLVSALLGGVSDADAGALQGIAVVGLTEKTKGTWQYSLDAGGTWLALGNPSGTAARHLLPTNKVRFLPNANYNGTPQLTFRAWDRSNALGAGSVASTSGQTGGTGAYSTASKAAGLSVTAVNDAPVLNAGVAATLGSIAEDLAAASNSGRLVSDLIAGITDVDAGAVKGIAVIGLTEKLKGTWQYSLNGGTSWLALGNPSDTAARLLVPTNRVRFLPNANYNGTPQLTFRAWDRSNALAAGSVSSTAGQLGGGGAYSTASKGAKLTVTAVNDAPVLNTGVSVTLGSIAEDTPPGLIAGKPVSDLLAGVTDVDTGALKGIAVIGLTEKLKGTWQYSIDGGASWLALGNPSDTAARLLLPTNRVRFLPSANYNGTPQLTFRAWDQSNSLAAGSVASTSGQTGGSGAYSTASKGATLTVTPVTENPVITLSGSVGYVHDAAAIALAPNAGLVDDNANFANGVLTVSISGTVNASNLLEIGGGFTVDGSGNIKQGTTLIGTRNAGGGVGTTNLVVTFTSAATTTIVRDLIRAITFRTVGGAAGQRVITFSLTDGLGGISNSPTKTVNVS